VSLNRRRSPPGGPLLHDLRRAFVTRQTRSPDARRVVGVKGLVLGAERRLVEGRLGDDEPIEGIAGPCKALRGVRDRDERRVDPGRTEPSSTRTRARLLRPPRLQTAALLAFAGLSLVLVLLSVHSVAASLLVRRRRELGIRLAIGCPPPAVAVEVGLALLQPVRAAQRPSVTEVLEG